VVVEGAQLVGGSQWGKRRRERFRGKNILGEMAIVFVCTHVIYIKGKKDRHGMVLHQRGRMLEGIIRTFRQNGPFWHSLVVCEVILVHLVVQVATLKTTGSFGGFFSFYSFYFLFYFIIIIYIYIYI
jgi:hypothetical protein